MVDHVKQYRRNNPQDVITVLIPEYVTGRWWEQLLHNHSALRIKGRLMFQPGVIVTSVPYQLRSGTARAHRPDTGDRHSLLLHAVRHAQSAAQSARPPTTDIGPDAPRRPPTTLRLPEHN